MTLSSPRPATPPTTESATDAPTERERPTVAIAGATGFVGTALRHALADSYRFIGLTRSPTRAERADDPTVAEWRRCDLFSLRDVTRALDCVDYAIYLVHSMLPSARLTQGDFADFDLLLADNFARAAERCGVRQIVYLGGLIPDGDDQTRLGSSKYRLSKHLASRLEVEETLGCCGVPLTALRAGLVVGPGGSSLRILLRLVRRLPVMALPRWTRTETQPIALADIVRAVELCLGDPSTYGRHFDLGGPDVMTYRSMMQRTAELMDVRRPMLDVPFVSPGLSKAWVILFSGSSRALVGPLVDSLRHEMVAQPNPLLERLLPDAVSFDAALATSLEGRVGLPNPRSSLRKSDDRRIRRERRVRSVQRLPLPPGRDAAWARRRYARWLPRFVFPFLRATVGPAHGVDDARTRFYLRILPWPLLELTLAPDESTPDRQILYITGGLLARTTDDERPGRLEFRVVDGGNSLIAAIHDFSPTLPWFLYSSTQALVHLFVMKSFGRHLARRAAPR
ncbi:MAG: NAD-dependent epimerase/dehydratase family protein [Acidobacteriota bacterium]